MVMRRVAVVGDMLERGGRILPYKGPSFTVGDAGHQVALIGGAAYCETCKSTGVIAKAGGPRRISFMGETAADRDIVLCHCLSPQTIVAKLAGESWCDDMAETLGTVTSSKTSTGGVASVAMGRFSEQVQVVANVRIDGYPYFIATDDGRILSGVTASGERLPRVHTGTAASFSVYWGDDALSKQAAP